MKQLIFQLCMIHENNEQNAIFVLMITYILLIVTKKKMKRLKKNKKKIKIKFE